MKKRINSIGITLYDNKPQMLPNHWNEPDPSHPRAYKSRYNLNISMMTGQTKNLNLACHLHWPPSELRTRSSWVINRDFYEEQVAHAEFVRDEIRAGRINAQLPMLLGIPHGHISTLNPKTKRRHNNWLVPQTPSLIMAIKKNDMGGYWDIKWVWPNDNLSFRLDPINTEVSQVNNKKNYVQSTRLVRHFKQRYDLPEDLITAEITDYSQGKPADAEYQLYAQRIRELLSGELDPLVRWEVDALNAKYPAYAEQFIKEMK
jgi:hypothetical protein